MPLFKILYLDNVDYLDKGDPSESPPIQEPLPQVAVLPTLKLWPGFTVSPH